MSYCVFVYVCDFITPRSQMPLFTRRVSCAIGLLGFGEHLEIFLQSTLYSGPLFFPELGPGHKRHVADPQKMCRQIIQNILFTAFEKLSSNFGSAVLLCHGAGKTI